MLHPWKIAPKFMDILAKCEPHIKVAGLKGLGLQSVGLELQSGS
jgi:hypothetical protein